MVDHVARCRFAAVSRKHCEWACKNRLLRSVLEFGERTDDEVALLLKFGQPSIELNFSLIFNAPVNSLPDGVTRLNFGGAFNQSVNKLPVSVAYVTFRGSFNQAFGGDFNQPVDDLPPHLRQI